MEALAPCTLGERTSVGNGAGRDGVGNGNGSGNGNGNGQNNGNNNGNVGSDRTASGWWARARAPDRAYGQVGRPLVPL